MAYGQFFDLNPHTQRRHHLRIARGSHDFLAWHLPDETTLRKRSPCSSTVGVAGCRMVTYQVEKKKRTVLCLHARHSAAFNQLAFSVQFQLQGSRSETTTQYVLLMYVYFGTRASCSRTKVIQIRLIITDCGRGFAILPSEKGGEWTKYQSKIQGRDEGRGAPVSKKTTHRKIGVKLGGFVQGEKRRKPRCPVLAA